MRAHRDPQRGPPGGGRNSGAHGDVREERHIRRDRARGRSRAFRGGGRVGTGTGRGGRQSLRSFLGPRGSRVVPGRRPVPPPGTGSEDRAYAAPAAPPPSSARSNRRAKAAGSAAACPAPFGAWRRARGPGLLGTGLRGVCVSITQPHCADENPLEVSPRSLTGCLRPCESPQPNAMLMNHQRSKSTL